jgi:glycosyltransferase involved in cell wall biosynthesis
VECNKNVFVANGVRTPIRVVPHIYSDSDADDSFERSDRYKVLFDHLSKNYRVYYTIGQWNERKGITQTVETFCSAFEADSQVCLVLKTFMETYSDYDAARCQFTLDKLLKKYKNPPKVFLITDSLPRKHIRLMHKSFDCFFSLCKSEGWGLGAFEAAGEGNYVIITGFGGQTEFLPAQHCSLVNYGYEKVKNMERFFWYGIPQYWAKPDVNDAVLKLKKSRFTERRKNEALAEHIKQNYGSEAVLKLMSESLTTA